MPKITKTPQMFLQSTTFAFVTLRVQNFFVRLANPFPEISRATRFHRRGSFECATMWHGLDLLKWPQKIKKMSLSGAGGRFVGSVAGQENH